MLFSVIPREQLAMYKYVVIIPQDGCEGCITYAEEFYTTNKNNPQIKFIFTNIISEKKLKKRLEITDSTTIDKDGLLIENCEESERLYPVVIKLDNGFVKKITFQSPTEDGLFELDYLIEEGHV